MLRAIGAVILGYVVMVVFVMLAFTIVYLAMGTERAFQAGSYDVSTMWLVVSLVLGLVAAILGGLVCVLIAKRPTPPLVLAGIVLVLGLLLAAAQMVAPLTDRVHVRDVALGNFEAMQNAQQPTWVTFVNPFLGAVGVVLGARFKRADQPPPS